jgi:hypothetical protein
MCEAVGDRRDVCVYFEVPTEIYLARSGMLGVHLLKLFILCREISYHALC